MSNVGYLLFHLSGAAQMRKTNKRSPHAHTANQIQLSSTRLVIWYVVDVEIELNSVVLLLRLIKTIR